MSVINFKKLKVIMYKDQHIYCEEIVTLIARLLISCGLQKETVYYIFLNFSVRAMSLGGGNI